MGSGFFQRRYFDSVAYLLALILFFLPFVELKHENIAVGNMEINMPKIRATGFELIQSKPKPSSAADTGWLGTSKPQNYIWLLALLAGLLGLSALILSLLNFRNRPLITSMAAFLAVIAMAALFIHFRDLYGTREEMMAELGIRLGFTAWFYLALLLFLLGSTISFSQRNFTPHDEQPIPPKAPQLDLENPGDQSNFPRSASESEIG